MSENGETPSAHASRAYHSLTFVLPQGRAVDCIKMRDTDGVRVITYPSGTTVSVHETPAGVLVVMNEVYR